MKVPRDVEQLMNHRLAPNRQVRILDNENLLRVRLGPSVPIHSRRNLWMKKFIVRHDLDRVFQCERRRIRVLKRGAQEEASEEENCFQDAIQLCADIA